MPRPSFADKGDGVVSAASRDPADGFDPEWIERIRRALVGWYREYGRELPWRADRDPYRVLVSETMLVQTTVAAVVPYFARFLQRFPDVRTLAEADEAEVLKAWEGLGYYRRARQLHSAAKRIVADFGGAIPADVDALRGLPGVGRYIAGAVGSFAFDLPAPIVEANTQRVLARWLAIETDIKSSATQARLWDASQRLVPPTGAGEFNQAFMELGGTICSSRSPRCLVCPVSQDCHAREKGIQNEIPKSTPKNPPLAVSEAAALIEREGRFLVVKRAETGLWPGFWEFPTIHVSGANPAQRPSLVDKTTPDLAEGVRALTGVKVQIGSLAKTVSFAVTRHKVVLEAYRGVPIDFNVKTTSLEGCVLWADHKALTALTFGAASRRLFPLLGGEVSEGLDP